MLLHTIIPSPHISADDEQDVKACVVCRFDIMMSSQFQNVDHLTPDLTSVVCVWLECSLPLILQQNFKMPSGFSGPRWHLEQRDEDWARESKCNELRITIPHEASASPPLSRTEPPLPRRRRLKHTNVLNHQGDVTTRAGFGGVGTPKGGCPHGESSTAGRLP